MYEKENLKVLLSTTQEKNKHLQEYVKQMETGYEKLTDQYKKLLEKYEDKKLQIKQLQNQISNQELKKKEMQQKINELSSHNCYEYLYQFSQSSRSQQKSRRSMFFLDREENNSSEQQKSSVKNEQDEYNNTQSFNFENSIKGQIGNNNSNNFSDKKFKIDHLELVDSIQDLNYVQEKEKEKQKPTESMKKRNSKDLLEQSGKQIALLRYSYQGSLTPTNNNINQYSKPNLSIHPLRAQQQNVENGQEKQGKNQNLKQKSQLETEPELIKPNYKAFQLKKYNQSSNSLLNNRSFTRRKSWRKFNLMIQNQSQQLSTPQLSTTAKNLKIYPQSMDMQMQNITNNNSSNINNNNSNFSQKKPFYSEIVNNNFSSSNYDTIQQNDCEGDDTMMSDSFSYPCLREEREKKNLIQNSNIGDLLFEDFFVIGPNLQELETKGKNCLKKSRQAVSVNVEPEISYRYCPQLEKHNQYLSIIKQRVFPFNTDAEIFEISVNSNTDIPSKIKDVIYPKSKNLGFQQRDQRIGFGFSQDDQSSFSYQQAFVLNFNSEISYKNQFNINNVMVSSNPSSTLYCVCLQSDDFYLLRSDLQNGQQQLQQQGIQKTSSYKAQQGNLDEKESMFNANSINGNDKKMYKVQKLEKIPNLKLTPGQYKIARVPKVLCFLTYFPFVKFFVEICKSIQDTLKLELLKKIMNVSSFQLFSFDYSTQAMQIQKQQQIQVMLNKMQLEFPEFSKLLYFRDLDVFTSPVNQWIPPVAQTNFLESEWGIGLVVSNFSYNDFWQILLCMVQEQHIVFFTEDLALLTGTMMTFQALLKPLSFPHLVNFNVNVDLINLIDSPVPYMLGVNKDINNFKELLNSNGIDIDSLTLIDLNQGCIYFNTFDVLKSQQNQQILLNKCCQPSFGEYNNRIKEQYLKINPNIQSQLPIVPQAQPVQQIQQIQQQASRKDKKKKKQSTQLQNQEKSVVQEQKQISQMKKNKLIYIPNSSQQKILYEILRLLHEAILENIVKFIPDTPIYENGNIKSCAEIRENNKNNSNKINSANNLNSENGFKQVRQKVNSEQNSLNNQFQKQRILDYKKILEIIRSNHKQDKKFYDCFLNSQIFTYYLEQKYQLIQQNVNLLSNSEEYDLEKDDNSFSKGSNHNLNDENKYYSNNNKNGINNMQINQITEENEHYS